MKYNGKELIEITPDEWDGKPKEMLVWWDHKPQKRVVVGYFKFMTILWLAYEDSHTGQLMSWRYCAEIPTEEQEKGKSIFKPCGVGIAPDLLK